MFGVIYRSDKLLSPSEWMDKIESLFGHIVSQWDGLIVITGDMNIDLLKENDPLQRQYNGVLEALNLNQHVTKATRTTIRTSTLIDHIISNNPSRVTHTDVLPCDHISDHDAPYACINIRINKFQPRFKYIRNEKKLSIKDYVKDFSMLPLSLIYSTDEPDDMVDILSRFMTECIDSHAPLKRTKVTRPPAPWLKHLDIMSLQQQRDKLRCTAHRTKSGTDWEAYRKARNELKTKIKETKRKFLKSALSSRRPKDVWKTIHRVLSPSPRLIKANVNDLNKHFNSTAERILECSPSNMEDLFKTVEGLQCQDNSFTLALVTYNEVLNAIKSLRNDCSTGPDQIPTKFIKPIAEFLASPLCHIINTCIQTSAFPTKWKTARISPIPKVDDQRANDDYRPVSILPVLSKIFERLVMNQIVDFIEKEQILNEKVCGYRKGHSTVTALLGIKDMIVQAMGRGEITLMVLADFSKAFDTIDYKTLLYKMHALKFSNSFLKWLLNYLDNRHQFVQVDDKMSELMLTRFGVPQGSILGPVLFNLYVTDLQGEMEQPCFQYADDTTIVAQGRPKNCCSIENAMNNDLVKLNSWSVSANLALNPRKTKVMVLSTKQLSRHHNLDDFSPALKIGQQQIEREKSVKLLGVILDQHLLWEDHVNKVTSSCFGALSILKKFKNIMSLKLKKQVAELLILSKLDYADAVFRPLSLKLQKRLQKVENAAASFVLGR